MLVQAAFLLLLLLLTARPGGASVSGAGVAMDGNGDLLVTAAAGGTVFLQSVDVAGAVEAAHTRLLVLEAAFRLESAGMPELPTNPAAALCWCNTSSNDCAPAVRFANGTVTCCAADQAVNECRWTGLAPDALAAAAQCRTVLALGGPGGATYPLQGTDDKVV